MSKVHINRRGYITTATSLPSIARSGIPITSTNVFFLSAAGGTISDAGGNSVSLTSYGSPFASGSYPSSFSTSTQLSVDMPLNSYIIGANTNVFAFGTGDYTVEGFYYFRSLDSYSPLWESGGNGAPGSRINSALYYANSSGQIGIYSNGDNQRYTPTSSIGLNTWYHVAYVRISGVHSIYINGVSQTLSGPNNFQTQTYNGCLIHKLTDGGTGSPYSANYILSNFRIVKGYGLYTGNFTAPTSDLSTSPTGTGYTTDYGARQQI